VIDTIARARELLSRSHGSPVITIYFDLDPERFATAPARESQARSLIDEGRRLGGRLELDHHARVTLESDLDRVAERLGSAELPVSGPRALALFQSTGDALQETVPLDAPTESRVFVEPVPHIEQLVTSPALGEWCAVLVSSDSAEIVEGEGRSVTARSDERDFVRGSDQTGEGQKHGREQDIEGHLLRVAEELRRRRGRDRFELLALAGPTAAVSALEGLLHEELRPILAGRLQLDPSAATDAGIVAAVWQLAEQRHAERSAEMLAELGSRMAGDGRGTAAGIEDVERALVERRVGTLLVGRDTPEHDNRREAMIQTAVLQDADVLAFEEPVQELPPPRPVAALLRF
jgi:peptide chain release factor subunit 1